MWVSLGVQGSRQCRGDDEGEQTGVWRQEVGDSQHGRVC